MGQNKRDIDAVVIPEKKVAFFTSTETGEVHNVELYEHSTYVDCSSYTCTISLPWVAEAEGMQYLIKISSGTEEMSVKDKAGTTIYGAEDTGDYVIVRSDGKDWTIVENYEAD